VSTSSTSSAKHIASAHSRLHPAGPVVVPCGGSADASKHCNSIPNVASASPTTASTLALRSSALTSTRYSSVTAPASSTSKDPSFLAVVVTVSAVVTLVTATVAPAGLTAPASAQTTTPASLARTRIFA